MKPLRANAPEMPISDVYRVLREDLKIEVSLTEYSGDPNNGTMQVADKSFFVIQIVSYSDACYHDIRVLNS